MDGADHQVLALRAGKAAGRPPVPLPGEGRAAEEDAGPAEVIPPGRMAPAGELLTEAIAVIRANAKWVCQVDDYK